MALRGTTSVEDIITDSVAEPEKLDPEWIPKCIRNQASGPLYAHAGIKAAADAVLKVLLSSCPCHSNVLPNALGGLGGRRPLADSGSPKFHFYMCACHSASVRYRSALEKCKDCAGQY